VIIPLQPDTPFSCPHIREQVTRILGGADFRHAERLRRFLLFIVEETLCGRGDRLKAYSIALAVFDRGATFDPQLDPIVRVEAGRLRRALEHYYVTEGAYDRVLIGVPKGGYVPRFELRGSLGDDLSQVDDGACQGEDEAHTSDKHDPAPRPMALTVDRLRWLGLHWKAIAAIVTAGLVALVAAAFYLPARANSTDAAAPILLVLSFRPLADPSASMQIAAELSSSIVDLVASGTGLQVMGRETTGWGQPGTTLSGLRHDYGLTHILEGDVIARSGQLTVLARLVDTRTNTVIWVRRYDQPALAPLASVEADLSSRLLTTLGRSTLHVSVPRAITTVGP
jgi:adenylate cyclase